MWPVWLLSLLTTAKSFKDNPIIGSRTLNRLGLHVIRVLLARLITWFRWLLLTPFMPKEYRRSFHKNGYVAIEDFLSAADIQRIRAEIKSHTGSARAMTQGNTVTQRILLDNKALIAKPTLGKLCRSQKLNNMLRYGAASLSLPLLYIQRIRNGYREGTKDPQKNMHADTFHPTMKGWLFLEDVTPEKGPFTYVPGSQRLTYKRLKWEYTRSLTAASNPDGYSEKGSFRASSDDLSEMDLPNPLGVSVTAGTLVIANTNGFHGRGQAQDGASRLEIWAYNRPNPFNPLPGLPFNFVRNIKYQILQSFWTRKDKQAANKASRPSWYLINAHEITDFDTKYDT